MPAGMTQHERLTEWIRKIDAETSSANRSARDALSLIGEQRDPPAHPIEDPVDTSGPGPVEDEALRSSLFVGFAEGKPGETVSVEIVGGTHVPVRGFSLAIGLNPMLDLVGVAEPPELKQLLNVDDIEDIKKQHRRGQGWRDNWIQVLVAFYEQLWGTPDADDAVADAEAGERKKIGRQIVDVMIPPMTPLYILKIKIPQDAKPGMEFPLDMEQRYGRYIKSGPSHSIFLGWPPMYATDRHVAKHGITKKEIDIASGWIKVIE